MAWDDVLEAINGKKITHDGISGTIRVERVFGRTKVSHEADARGRKSEKYRSLRRQLRDDWYTDLSESDPETLVKVAAKVVGGMKRLDELAKK